MHSVRLPAVVRLGFVLALAMPLIGYSFDHSPSADFGPLLGLVVVTAVTVAGAAWALGRRGVDRSDREAARRWAMLEQVGEEIAWECDADGRFAFVSPQCLSAFGYRPEEAQALTLFDVVHPDDHADMSRLLAAGRGWRRRTFRCVARDGSSVWLRSNAVVRRDAGDRPIGLCGTSHVLEAGPADACAARSTAAAVRRVLQTQSVRTVFQPIVCLTDQRVVGVEALSRFTVAGDDRTPEDWFVDAARVGLGVDLEVHTLRLALRAARELPDGLYVAVNLSPETLMWSGLRATLAHSVIPPERIVVEITEHSSVQDYDGLGRALGPLRDAGMRVAVDDAGAGYASFRHILALSPEVIKLDRTLIAGIDRDPARRALAAAVVAFAADTGSQVTAEGIERPEELRTVTRLGVECGQGHLFGPPSTPREDWLAWQSRSPVVPSRALSGGDLT